MHFPLSNSKFINFFRSVRRVCLIPNGISVEQTSFLSAHYIKKITVERFRSNTIVYDIKAHNGRVSFTGR